MKRFLLSMIVLLAIPGLAFTCEEPTVAPQATVKVFNDACDRADEAALSVVQDVGPRADNTMRCFRSAVLFWDGQVDVTELKTLGDEAYKNYGVARRLFRKCNVYATLGSILADEANEVEGVKADVLRIEAASCYYKAVTCAEDAYAALETVLELGEKGRALVEKWQAEVETEVEVEAEDKVSV